MAQVILFHGSQVRFLVPDAQNSVFFNDTACLCKNLIRTPRTRLIRARCPQSSVLNSTIEIQSRSGVTNSDSPPHYTLGYSFPVMQAALPSNFSINSTTKHITRLNFLKLTAAQGRRFFTSMRSPPQLLLASLSSISFRIHHNPSISQILAISVVFSTIMPHRCHYYKERVLAIFWISGGHCLIIPIRLSVFSQ